MTILSDGDDDPVVPAFTLVLTMQDVSPLNDRSGRWWWWPGCPCWWCWPCPAPCSPKKGFFFALMKVNNGNFNYSSTSTQAQVGGIHNPTLYQETFSWILQNFEKKQIKTNINFSNLPLQELLNKCSGGFGPICLINYRLWISDMLDQQQIDNVIWKNSLGGLTCCCSWSPYPVSPSPPARRNMVNFSTSLGYLHQTGHGGGGWGGRMGD